VEAIMAFTSRILGPFLGLSCTLAITTLVVTTPASAQDAASFYKGRTVQAVVGYSPGSTFELYLRMLTRHIGKHIPGNPNIVVQHMPGAGSLKATNYLAAIASKDGSVFGMPNGQHHEPLIDPKNRASIRARSPGSAASTPKSPPAHSGAGPAHPR
jgi:tripartite-type tricarboxylate transporter receptor subunit TctC